MKPVNWLSNLIIRIIDWFYIPFQGKISEQSFRYIVCGGVNTLLDIGLFAFNLHYVVKNEMVDLKIVKMTPHIAAYVFAFPILFCVGFFLSKFVTFTQSELKGRVQLFRYFTFTVMAAVAINYGMLKLLIEVCKMNEIFSKIITTVFVATYSYVSQRFFSFKSPKKLLV